ncbi:TniB family NTP-binding protein [Gimibacter soli]|uniref:TniB family NTP-binding protein n=1 Tax=Gimibacter soli TaxID=3024400 RepID=A0AAF0BMJ1_9PROT|nr:TniB family NTP-binding protein [Gimibacter soli]WCL55607.1 TniB family NTP-binding protein [Gimibacter soli]
MVRLNEAVGNSVPQTLPNGVWKPNTARPRQQVSGGSQKRRSDGRRGAEREATTRPVSEEATAPDIDSATAPDRTHLINDAVRQMVDMPLKRRLDYVFSPHWYNLDYAVALEERFDELREEARLSREAIGMRIVSPSGMAKSLIMRHYCDKHRPYQDKKARVTITPALFMEIAPGHSGVTDVMSMIYQALKAPYQSGSFDRRKVRCIADLEELNIQILMVDEINIITNLPDDIAIKILNMLKWLNNSLGIPLVLGSTPGKSELFKADHQYARRFRPYHLAKWQLDDAYARAVSTIMAYMPLAEPPEAAIFEDEGLSYLLRITDYETSSLVRLIKFATRMIMKEDGDRLSLDALRLAAATYGYSLHSED